MKKILFTFLGTLIFYIAGAQDTIVLRNDSTIRAKVVEVGVSEIKYKKLESPDGPVYVIDKSEVQMIKYENGHFDTFAVKKDKTIQSSAAVKTTSRPSKKKDFGNIYAALSVPLGSFAESREGAALLGWGVGLNGLLGDTGVSMSYQVSYTIHPYEFDINVNGANYTLKGDYNVWHLLAGLGARGKPATMTLYMYAMVGLNYTVLTGALEEIGYSDAISFVLSLGAGLIINQSFNLGIKFMHSKPDFKNSDSSSAAVEQKISMFQLTGGFQF